MNRRPPLRLAGTNVCAKKVSLAEASGGFPFGRRTSLVLASPAGAPFYTRQSQDHDSRRARICPCRKRSCHVPRGRRRACNSNTRGVSASKSREKDVSLWSLEK